MNDFDDDDDLDLDDTGFDDFEDDQSEGGNTLGDLWRNNPFFKVGAIILVIVVLFLLFKLLSNNDEAVGLSNVPASPEVAATPGGEGASQAYVEAVVDENSRRFEEALTSGGSVIPTPIDPRTPILSIAPEEDEGEDPLDRWRRLQEQRASLAAVAPPEPQETPEEASRRLEAVQLQTELMIEQMTGILEDQSEIQVNSLTFTDPSYLATLFPEEEEVVENDADQELEPGTTIILPAGEIEYAQLITQANSDVPGPVLAEIAGGPLSGARVLGSFTVVRELLTLTFQSIIIDDITYPINAVALDPGTTLPGVATDVDHHYLQRIFLPAAAAFIEGFASAVANTGRTDITIQNESVATETEEADDEQRVGAGIEVVGAELSEIIDEINDDLEVTVVVAAGTPLGLLFTEPVIVPDTVAR